MTEQPGLLTRAMDTAMHHKILNKFRNAGYLAGWKAGLLSLLLIPALALAEPGFWQASKEGRHLWILGSIHTGQDNFYPLPQAIEQAWQKADVLILEANLRDMSPEENQRLAALTQLPVGQHLRQQLSPALYQKTVAASKKLGLPEAGLDQLRPWAVAITLTQQALQKAGFQSDLGVDEHFAAAATRTGLPIRGLERVPEQLAYLANLGQLEPEFLSGTLSQIDNMQAEIPKLIQAWQNGDGPALQNLLKDEDGTSPALQEYMARKLIGERNHNWVPKLLAMPEKNQFLVVGALHLYGPDGLLTLLRQQGYQIQLMTDAHE